MRSFNRLVTCFSHLPMVSSLRFSSTNGNSYEKNNYGVVIWKYDHRNSGEASPNLET